MWFMDTLDTRAEALRRESCRLAEDERRDEGDLMKIRANVYGICKSVFQTLGRERGSAKLEKLRETWTKALEAARGQEDLEKAAVEQIKLETLDEIFLLVNERHEV